MAIWPRNVGRVVKFGLIMIGQKHGYENGATMGRIVCIVQARMGSQRLSNKVIADISGKPMLQHVIERVSRAKLVDEVVVAYPGNPVELNGENRPIERLINVMCEGFNDGHIPENDLVGRYYRAARFYKADLIVRVCADNPLIEPGEIDRLIETFPKNPHFQTLWQNAQPHNGNNYPDGIGAELYTLEQLDLSNTMMVEPNFREHPHKFYYENIGYGTSVDGPQCPPEFVRPDLRLDVNTQADLDYIREIYAQFPDNTFHITQVIKYLNAKDVGMAV